MSFFNSTRKHTAGKNSFQIRAMESAQNNGEVIIGLQTCLRLIKNCKKVRKMV